MWQQVSKAIGALAQKQHCPTRPSPPHDTRPVSVVQLFLRKAICVAVMSVVFAFGFATPSQAAGGNPFLIPQKTSPAPAGFTGLCDRYAWVCTRSQAATSNTRAQLAKAEKVNRAVNRQVREIDDQDQYGVAEFWALPTTRGGDCEDLVLLKKKLLVEQGVPSQALLIATVLDRRMNSHAVLVFRTKQGDLVLDNLTDRILPWGETGYTFLKLQNPRVLERWDAVMAGGIIKDRPTASR